MRSTVHHAITFRPRGWDRFSVVDRLDRSFCLSPFLISFFERYMDDLSMLSIELMPLCQLPRQQAPRY